MARRQGSGCGCAFAIVFLALLVLAGVCVWRFGLVDRLLYLAQTQQLPIVASSQSAPAVERQQRGYYVYDQLDEADCELYDIMLDSFESREERTFPETSMDELARIRDFVLADHPELFYINGVNQLTTTNQQSGLVVGLTIEGQYSYSTETAAQLQASINAAVAECLAAAPEGDDYAKARYFYEYLAQTTDYDRDIAIGDDQAWAEDGVESSAGQTIADVFANGKAVCGGYARAFQYLLQRSGIQCAYITGDANGGRHAWCLAYLDGAYYYVDPTWGDPQFLSAEGEQVEGSNYVNYDYLCVTSEDISRTHVATTEFSLPECTSTVDNYYVREGLMFETADVDRLGALAAQAAAEGTNVQIRCATSDVYTQLLDDAVSSGQLAAYLPTNTYRFTHSDDFLTIAVFPT